MARMVTLVEQARKHQGASQQFTKRFTRIFVPTILIGTLRGYEMAGTEPGDQHRPSRAIYYTK